jgi:putative flippase GtrA
MNGDTGRFRRALHYLLSATRLRAQSARFVLAGGTVALLSIIITIILADVVGLPFQLSFALTVAAALVVHFTLQRLFVWRHPDAFAFRLHQQVWRYLLVAGGQYALTAALTATVPRLLDVRVEIVFVLAVVFVTVLNFVLLRYIFHSYPGSDA